MVLIRQRNLISIATVALVFSGWAPLIAQIIPIGDLPGGGFKSNGYGISGDGSTVVGLGGGPVGEEAFRWTASGIEGLGYLPGGIGSLPGGGSRSWARDVSTDGSVVVGYSGSANGEYEAFVWSQGTGMLGLGDFPGAPYYSLAYAVSGDGSTVVGHSSITAVGERAFKWTSGSGMEVLPFQAAVGISTDGNVVVGYNGREACRWTQATGVVGLGHLPGGWEQTAL